MNENKSPLGGHADQAEAECDTIYTAAILGFALTRTLLKQPFSFDVEPDNSEGNADYHDRVVDKIVTLLPIVNFAEAAIGNAVVSSGRIPMHGGKDDAMITGLPGAGTMAVEARNRPLRAPQASNMAEFEYLSGEKGGVEFHGQYHGRGAYTGMIDDVVGDHTLIQPTIRRVITDPRRWYGEADGIWGLIAGDNRLLKGSLDENVFVNLSSDPRKGMGPLDSSNGLVQYVHGMSWAMREAQRWGPWTVAYEMAVGELTKKRASCFACTTYMWSSGFPASSTHLGRCESWGLLPDGSEAEYSHVFSEGAEGELEKQIAQSMNCRWHIEMYHQLRIGSRILCTVADSLSEQHRQPALKLATRFERQDPRAAATGGNLFLDAITWHKSDTKRIGATFGI